MERRVKGGGWVSVGEDCVLPAYVRAGNSSCSTSGSVNWFEIFLCCIVVKSVDDF